MRCVPTTLAKTDPESPDPLSQGVVAVSFERPYHLYPLLGIVLLIVAVAAIVYRIKHPVGDVRRSSAR